VPTRRERREADLQHLSHRRLDADLEQEQNHAQLGEILDRRIGLQPIEERHTGKCHVSEDDAGDELAEHGRLSDPDREVPAQLGRRQDDREQQEHVGDAVRSVHGSSILAQCAATPSDRVGIGDTAIQVMSGRGGFRRSPLFAGCPPEGT
jgi:hypothetical protein